MKFNERKLKDRGHSVWEFHNQKLLVCSVVYLNVETSWEESKHTNESFSHIFSLFLNNQIEITVKINFKFLPFCHFFNDNKFMLIFNFKIV